MRKLSTLKNKLKSLDKKMTKKKILIYTFKPKKSLDELIKSNDLHIYLNINTK